MLQKAIKHFESLQKRYTTQHNGKQCEYVKVALEAMRKRVPQIPVIKITEKDEFGDSFIFWFCPDCNAKLEATPFEDRHDEYLRIKPKSCHNCQKLIDWSNCSEQI